MKIGDKIPVIEKTYTGEIFEWEGIIVRIESNFYETVHSRNTVTHPQWINGYLRAYEKTWTKHYIQSK